MLGGRRVLRRAVAVRFVEVVKEIVVERVTSSETGWKRDDTRPFAFGVTFPLDELRSLDSWKAFLNAMASSKVATANAPAPKLSARYRAEAIAPCP